MQNRYVGDVGDFGKYGLLRWLCGMREGANNCPIDIEEDELRLSVLWWLNSPEGNQDGRHIGYLNNTPPNRRRFLGCDDVLYSKMRNIVRNGNRNVGAIRQQMVLPWDTIFFSPKIPRTPTMPAILIERARANWLNDAIYLTEHANLIFVDPDNGIASGNINSNSPKHVTMSELRALARKDKSLLVYHHPAQGRGLHNNQVRDVGNDLRRLLPHALIESFRFRGGTSRSYFLVVQDTKHQDLLIQRLECFRESDWCERQRRLFVPFDQHGNPL